MIFAYREEFATAPLADALRRRGWGLLPTDNPAEALLAGSADIALTPALDYGRSIGVVDFALVPGVAIMTRGFAGLVKLVFNRNLESFSSMAVKHREAAEVTIAQIVLSEKHDITPDIIPVPEDLSIEQMLQKADCALLAGDDAIFHTAGVTSLLDLTDEWEDAVEAPMPYMVAWGRVGAMPQAALEELVAARDEAVLTLADRAAQHQQAAFASEFYQRYLRGEIDYTLGEESVKALDAFFRYAFYYSTIHDMPAIKFLPDGEPMPLSP